MTFLRLSVLALFVLVAPAVSTAQYWRALPALSPETSQILSFTKDEKYVIYMSQENGVGNIFRIPVKGGAPEAITSFSEGKVLRPIATVGKNWVIFMRPTAGDGDYHLYMVSQDGTVPFRDLTPTKTGISNVIVGASYTGRYVYYTSNQTSVEKHDVYRYDVWQNISELVFANPNDFKPVSWTKEQTKVTLREPASGKMIVYDINTTELSNNIDINDEPLAPERSINGRFGITSGKQGIAVLDLQTKEPMKIAEDITLVGIAPKETMIAYTIPGASGSSKLFVYDVNKKTSTELAVIK
jgi:Tol biopolymer transport system component